MARAGSGRTRRPAGRDLAAYEAKRDFSRTPEPKAGKPSASGHSFVVQKHAARRLHYDFRLELDGVLKSWAVTRGPSLDPADKRLAVHVEDHPLDYGAFEGVIPAGEYGGGTVMLWDRGEWEPMEDPRDGLAGGHLKFRLKGERLKGGWALVRMGAKAQDERHDNWLLIKERDDEARPGEGAALLEENAVSVTTGRSMDEIARDRDRVHNSNREKDKPAKAPARSRAAKAAITAKSIPGARPGKLRAFIEPQLATLTEQAPAGAPWIHEIKLDGYRTLARIESGRVTMLTRTGLDWTKRFGGLPAALARLPVESAMIDGEVVVMNGEGLSSFGALQNALDGSGADLSYMVFDLLYLDGQDLTASPLIERKNALQSLMGAAGPLDGLSFSEGLTASGPDVLREACNLKLEGIISKRSDAPYRPGRGRDWLKVKCLNRQEFVIGGFVKPTNGGPGIGSLLVGTYDREQLVHAGRVGTGYTETVSRDLRVRLDKRIRATSPFGRLTAEAKRGAVWVQPDLVAEVEFGAWTADGLVRHAAFKGLREDKDPRQVVREAPAPAPRGEARPAKAAGRDSAVGGVALSNPDRILYPDQGLTKHDLAEFYVSVGEHILPHIAGRPISLVRCPQGEGAQCFFQRHAGAGLTSKIRRVPVKEDEGEEEYLAIDDLGGLISLVQMGVLEIHPWGARADDPDLPDRIILDLDPDEGLPFARVREAALEARDRLAALKLQSFVKVTGGKGLHVVLPIARKHDWPTIKAFARALAAAMQADQPSRYELNMSKKARKGKIFVDYLRNDRTSTAIAPYSTRARPGAPVAVPVTWEELSRLTAANGFTVTNMPRRLAGGYVDPWREMTTLRQSLTQRALDKMKVE